MKNITLTALIILCPNIYSMACNTIENGVKTMCNDYVNLKQKDPQKLKKLCSMGDIDSPYLKMKGEFLEGSCDPKGATGKCKVKGNDTTFYYTTDIASHKKGCQMLKNTEYIKL